MNAFLFYTDDWLSSKRVEQMDQLEELAYFRLLAYAAKEPDCGLPKNLKLLAKYSRLGPQWNKQTVDEEYRFNEQSSGQKVLACFEIEKNGRIYNVRLLRNFKSFLESQDKRRKAANARWHPGEAEKVSNAAALVYVNQLLAEHESTCNAHAMHSESDALHESGHAMDMQSRVGNEHIYVNRSIDKKSTSHTALPENQEEPSEPPKPIPEPEPRKPDRAHVTAAANVLSFPVVGTAAFQPIPVAHEHPGEGVTFGEWFAKYVKVTGVAFNGKVEERSRCLWNEIGFFDHRDVWNDLKALEEQLPWRQRFQRPDNYLRDQSWTEKSAFPRGKLPPRSEYRQRVEVELPSL